MVCKSPMSVIGDRERNYTEREPDWLSGKRNGQSAALGLVAYFENTPVYFSVSKTFLKTQCDLCACQYGARVPNLGYRYICLSEGVHFKVSNRKEKCTYILFISKYSNT